MPGDQSHVVDGVDYRTLEMTGHLEIVIVLNVTATYDGHFAVHDHVLCMESAKHLRRHLIRRIGAGWH